jgi:acyl-[acyl-carrier-protein]-phospholipid O-acyltransferase/long-chain-fatty-acid--[acyl-carrier-protein] ligase
VVGIIVVLAVVSWIFARSIPAEGPAAPSLAITANLWTSTVALLRELKGHQRLWNGGHIVSWFWVVGTVALSLLPPLVKDYIGGSEGVVILCQAAFVVGIATGSTLAARASHGTPNLALVPLGAALMGVFALVIGVIASLLAPGAGAVGPMAVIGTPTGLALLASLGGLAIAGGLFIVPAFAAVQAWAPADARARVIAAVNVMNAAYMVAAGAILAGLQYAGVGVSVLFAVLGVLSFGAMLYVRRAWCLELGRNQARESRARGEA